MNEIVAASHTGVVISEGALRTPQVLAHVRVVQDVMQSVMKREVHFGTIPGTQKECLFQPGADLLCVTFRIAPQFIVEDLSRAGVIRYRVTCIGKHQGTETVLGSSVGEASSNEDRYRWRRAICREEFDSFPAGEKRTKYARGKGGSFYTIDQVQVEATDVANTVLKMAIKRAKVGMVLTVTGASDMFNQDLEDIDAALRDSLVGQDGGDGRDGNIPKTPTPPTPKPTQAPTQAPKPASAQDDGRGEAKPVWPEEAFAKQFARWGPKISSGESTVEQVRTFAESRGTLTPDQIAQLESQRPAKAVVIDADGVIVDQQSGAQA